MCDSKKVKIGINKLFAFVDVVVAVVLCFVFYVCFYLREYTSYPILFNTEY